MMSQHYAGIITGVVSKDGLIQVTAVCKLGPRPEDSTLSLQLPIPPPERGEWAQAIGERIVLTMALVEAEETKAPEPDGPAVDAKGKNIHPRDLEELKRNRH